MVANMTQGGEGQKRRENKNFDPNSDIASFFSCNSRSALDLLLPGQGRSIDYFLSTDPNQWPNDDLYRNFQKQINVIKVVNDTAERGIALISDYNNVLTTDEDQKQHLYKVVTQERKNFPSTSKKFLSNRNLNN